MKTDAKVIGYSELTHVREKADKDGRTIVFTTGVYDLLHLGHVKHFDYAKSKGDILVVSVGNDETVKLLKGPTRPIHTAEVRARMVAALEAVGYVVISEELGKLDHNESVSLLRPDIYVVPGNDAALGAKIKLVEQNGGTVIKNRRVPPKGASGISTTSSIDRLTQG